MRYLKIFESKHSTKEVSRFEYEEFGQGRKVCKFTDDELKIIRSSISLIHYRGQYIDIDINNGQFQIHYSTADYDSYDITKFDDEWFMVQFYDKTGARGYWYICDQFEELIQVIKK